MTVGLHAWRLGDGSLRGAGRGNINSCGLKKLKNTHHSYLGMTGLFQRLDDNSCKERVLDAGGSSTNRFTLSHGRAGYRRPKGDERAINSAIHFRWKNERFYVPRG